MTIRDPHQSALMNAAACLGIKTVDLASTLSMDVVSYQLGDRTEWVRMGRIFSHLGALPQRLCDDKNACKAVLKLAGVPVPDGVRYRDIEDPAVKDLLGHGGLWVNKPLVGSHSQGVHLGLTCLEDVKGAFKKREGWAYILERQIEGADLRMQAVGGKFVAACRREPASILADGNSTVSDLIAARRVKVRADNPDNDLIIDVEVLDHLSRAGLGLESIPLSGRKIQLRATPSLSAGGAAIDLTDVLHQDWVDLVECIGEAIGIRVFAVDAVTPDPSLSPAEMGAVIEVNARPQWIHHTFSSGRQHDLPSMLLRDLFEI